MKHFLLAFIWVVTIPATFAQTTTWSINVMPTFSYRLSAINPISPLAETIQNGEAPMHSFDFGVDIRTRFRSRFMIGAGLFYSQKGFSNVHVASAYQQPTLSRAYLLDFMQDYLDIPLFITYTIAQNEKFEWYVLGGVNNSLLLRERNKVAVRSAELSAGEIPEEVSEQLHRPYLRASSAYSVGMLSGVGVRAKVDDRTSIGLEGLSKYVFTPLEDLTSDSQRRPYALGLNFRFIRTIR